MKKVLVLMVAMLLCGTMLHAQRSNLAQSRSTSLEITEVPSEPSSTQWILRAGANFAGFSGMDSDDEYEFGKKFAYDLALSFQKPLSDFGMFWGMEFALGTRGYTCDFEPDYGSYYRKTTLLAHNLRYSPFTFGYAYSVTESFKIDVHAGAWLSYDLFGTFNFEDTDEEESWSIGDYEDEEDITYNRLDYGLTLGIGLWYDRFNLDLSWQRGFNEVIKDSDATTNNIMLRLGVAF